MSKAEKELCDILKCNSQINIDGFWFDLWYKNKIVEYNGDYWHCNPNLYEKEYYNISIQMTANEKWKFDDYKINTAIKNGFDVLVIWESDYKKDPISIISKCKEFLYG